MSLRARRMAVLGIGLLAVLFLPVSRSESSGPPNVVVIHADDLGWADLGCYGSRSYQTPNLDRLATRGMVFTHAYASASVCSPSRAALLTGRYPARLGLTDWIRARFQGGVMPEDGENPGGWEEQPGQRLLVPRNPLWLDLEEVTLAEALKPAGYVPAHVGKWHLGMDPHYPGKQGFDYNIGGCDFGQPPSYFDPYRSERIPEGIPTLPPRREGEYLTDREADEAAQFIRKHQDRPFFLHLAPYAVHTPIQAPPELVERYRSRDLPGLQQDPVYAAMVESLDRAVGTVLQALEETGLSERTVVIFTSDNGGLEGVTSNAPLRSGKGYPYEGGIRVPLIVVWPGTVKPGSRSPEPVLTMDLFPTVLEMAGVPLPADRPIDGVSLTPLLKGDAEHLEREALFWHFPHYRHAGYSPYSVVRAREWKLIRFYDPPRLELFNVAEDAGETTEVSRGNRELLLRLEGRLDEWLHSVDARMPRQPEP